MVIFLFVNILVGQFGQKLYLNKGLDAGLAGKIMVCDSDRDSQTELIFAHYDCGQNRAVVYELYPDSVFHLETIIDTMCFNAWEVGDFDNDGLFDLVVTGDFGLPALGPQIFESPDSFSYPTREIWRDTVGPPLVLPICVYDIDQDGLPEIVKNRLGPSEGLGVYESVGDNQYELVFVDNPDTLNLDAPAAMIAFGDFDGDGRIEFVPAGGDERYWIYECIGNNNYEKIVDSQLPTFNIRDGFAVPDADCDGKPEFVLKGNRLSTLDVFIFEATGDNTYEVIQTFSLPGGNYYGGYSDAGDVDDDGVPEIVLEARLNIFIIKAAGNDSFYVWQTLPGSLTGSCVRVTNDLDNNGLNEIVISGNNQTRIYEYDPGKIEESSNSQCLIQNLKLTVSPNPFTDVANIKFQIPNLNDQTNSKSQIPNPPSPRIKYGAGSFSSPPRGEGWGEGLNSEIRNSQSEIELNLTTPHSLLATLRIYDATGRLVKSFSDIQCVLDYSAYSVFWNGTGDSGQILPAGVYYAVYEMGSLKATAKLVLLK